MCTCTDKSLGDSRIPHGDHVVVHGLELILGGLQGVRGRVDLVGLEALIGEADGERLVILLCSAIAMIRIGSDSAWTGVSSFPNGAQQTCGMFSACAEAASVVTERRVKGAKA